MYIEDYSQKDWMDDNHFYFTVKALLLEKWRFVWSMGRKTPLEVRLHSSGISLGRTSYLFENKRVPGAPHIDSVNYMECPIYKDEMYTFYRIGVTSINECEKYLSGDSEERYMVLCQLLQSVRSARLKWIFQKMKYPDDITAEEPDGVTRVICHKPRKRVDMSVGPLKDDVVGAPKKFLCDVFNEKIQSALF